jgi:hypothetical protein
MKKYSIILLLNLVFVLTQGQTIKFKKQQFQLKNVTGSITTFNGQKVLKIERDLNALAFDVNHLESTVDEPTYAKLLNVDFENGTIEVKMLSQIQNPSPFKAAQGFIGLAFRISEQDTAFESIYLRPRVGRSNNQLFRNHTVQYYAYPRYKFETLRKEAPGMYEGAAPVNINEWITMRIEVNGQTAELFINNARYSSFIVSKMKGSIQKGSIGLWVDIGTTGYFKDLKITKRPLLVKEVTKDKPGGI